MSYFVKQTENFKNSSIKFYSKNMCETLNEKNTKIKKPFKSVKYRFTTPLPSKAD